MISSTEMAEISLDEIEYELTNDCSITISSLTVDTAYRIDVCVVTMKGKGPSASIRVKTDSAGKEFRITGVPLIDCCFRRFFSTSSNIFHYRPPGIPCQMATAGSDLRTFISLRTSLQWSLHLFRHGPRVPCSNAQTRSRVYRHRHCHHQ